MQFLNAFFIGKLFQIQGQHNILPYGQSVQQIVFLKDEAQSVPPEKG